MIMVLYTSTALAPFSEADMEGLATLSRQRNQRLGVTGLLMKQDDEFTHLLEGIAEHVDALVRSIRQDDRHGDMEVHVRQPLERRRFDASPLDVIEIFEEEGSIRRY